MILVGILQLMTHHGAVTPTSLGLRTIRFLSTVPDSCIQLHVCITWPILEERLPDRTESKPFLSTARPRRHPQFLKKRRRHRLSQQRESAGTRQQKSTSFSSTIIGNPVEAAGRLIEKQNDLHQR